jgi:hypothetical protein
MPQLKFVRTGLKGQVRTIDGMSIELEALGGAPISWAHPVGEHMLIGVKLGGVTTRCSSTLELRVTSPQKEAVAAVKITSAEYEELVVREYRPTCNSL